MGGEGECRPKVEKISDWSEEKCDDARDSESKLRDTLMSTMEPVVMSGGRRMDGNSICGARLVRELRESLKGFAWGWIDLGLGYIPVFCLLLGARRLRHQLCQQSVKPTWWIVGCAVLFVVLYCTLLYVSIITKSR